jgi:uncharacterized surface protein with fasciclin (FAS1) repeats
MHVCEIQKSILHRNSNVRFMKQQVSSIIYAFKQKQDMKNLKQFALLFTIVFSTSAAFAQKSVEVGGAPMYPNKNIIENAVNSKDHTTLVAAVKAAGLVETLQGEGPFTVFAPTNAAFNMLPEGTIPALLKPENKTMLSNVLTYHVVAGKYDAAALMELIEKNNGKAMLKTVEGGTLYFTKKGNGIMLWDEKGGTANVTVKDVYQSNGVIHVIDHVVMPK